MPIDISSGFKGATEKINALKTYKDVSVSIKDAAKKQSSSIGGLYNRNIGTLDSITEFQNRVFRGVPTSLDQLFNLISTSKGSGNQTVTYLKKKLLEASINSQSEIKNILKEESFKVLGCSQQQTYKGIPSDSLTGVQSLSDVEGFLIPLKSIDLFGNLKNNPESLIGKLFYEKDEPSINSKYIPYGGTTPFPLNSEIYNRTQYENKSFSSQYGDYYKGKSQQPIFDFSYVKKNGEDYLKVVLINRETGNLMVDFLFDYYETINLYDSTNIVNNIVNIILGAFNIEAKIGYGDLKTQSKFSLIIQRILGLCFDDREEIDVSGTAKISEIDDFTDSIFKLTEIDLKNIDSDISNIQLGVVKFESCDNVQLPINSSNILNSILDYQENVSSGSVEEQIDGINAVIESIIETPDWKAIYPDTLNLKLAVDTDILKNLPKALVYSVLTPKILLPVFVLLKTIEREANENQEGVLNDLNNLVETENKINSEVNNFVNDSMDFLIKFKKFSIQVVSRIGALYLKTLYDILKKDILNLIKTLLLDINKTKLLKKYSIILTLSGILVSVANLIFDYRKCRSLLDNILNILNLVSTSFINKTAPSGGTDPIPAVLLPFTQFLPGFSPERAAINIIEEMQKLGLPTGPMPDGSPNLMLQFTIASQLGSDREETENGKVVGVIDPKIPLIVRAKKV